MRWVATLAFGVVVATADRGGDGCTGRRHARRRPRADDLDEHRLSGRDRLRLERHRQGQRASPRSATRSTSAASSRRSPPSGCRTRPCRPVRASPGPTSSPPTPPPASRSGASAPSSTVPVYALEVDPATNTLYVGGRFTTVDGQALSNFAILDATTGALKDGVTQLPVTGGGSHIVQTLYRHPLTNKLYIGGDFTTIGGHNRGEAARLSLPGNTLDNWKLQVNGAVLAFGLDQANPAPARVYVGGEFTAAAGDTNFVVHRGVRQHRPGHRGSRSPRWTPRGTRRSPASTIRPGAVASPWSAATCTSAMGGFGGRFFVFSEADATTPIVGWLLDGDVQTRVPDRQRGARRWPLHPLLQPARSGHRHVPITLRCQMFAVAADDPTNLLAVAEPADSSHYGPVRRGRRGQQRRRRPRQHLLGRPARPPHPGRRPDAAAVQPRHRPRASAAPGSRGPGAACGTCRRPRSATPRSRRRPGAVTVTRLVHHGQRVLAGGHRRQRHRRLLRLRERHAQEGRARETSRARTLTGFTADSVNTHPGAGDRPGHELPRLPDRHVDRAARPAGAAQPAEGLRPVQPDGQPDADLRHPQRHRLGGQATRSTARSAGLGRRRRPGRACRPTPQLVAMNVTVVSSHGPAS